jgi:hypothetical protein
MPVRRELKKKKIKRDSVYLKGRSEERYLAHYEQGKIPGEYEVILNLIVYVMEQAL